MPNLYVSILKIFGTLSFIDAWVKQQQFRSDLSGYFESICFLHLHFFSLFEKIPEKFKFP